MSKQGRALAAVAAFAFGCAVTLSAGAAGGVCQECWDNYHRCKNTPEFCDAQLQACLDKGDGKFPCPR